MRVMFDVIKPGIVRIRLKQRSGEMVDTHLTPGQSFDILLTRVPRSNKIERLSLKKVKIRGKMRPGVISGIVPKPLVTVITN